MKAKIDNHMAKYQKLPEDLEIYKLYMQTIKEVYNNPRIERKSGEQVKRGTFKVYNGSLGGATGLRIHERELVWGHPYREFTLRDRTDTIQQYAHQYNIPTIGLSKEDVIARINAMERETAMLMESYMGVWNVWASDEFGNVQMYSDVEGFKRTQKTLGDLLKQLRGVSGHHVLFMFACGERERLPDKVAHERVAVPLPLATMADVFYNFNKSHRWKSPMTATKYSWRPYAYSNRLNRPLISVSSSNCILDIDPFNWAPFIPVPAYNPQNLTLHFNVVLKLVNITLPSTLKKLASKTKIIKEAVSDTMEYLKFSFNSFIIISIINDQTVYKSLKSIGFFHPPTILEYNPDDISGYVLYKSS